ncbi:hypothetical protein [Ereboglobus sp. PH5-5]|uniref:tetratricopeptide repeat protein n=1 Tax=Ereboglobus sp. PH5-5 TaxID=2940529 RepID=UPI002406EE00|nr:hypothetical protein [Ereboglobus sp. PH5-5]
MNSSYTLGNCVRSVFGAVLLFTFAVFSPVVAQTKLDIKAAPDEPSGEIVELPRYVVTDERILPPPESWSYTTLPGYEILSNSRNFITQGFLKDFQQLQVAIDVIWPALLANKNKTPTLIVLCGRGNSFKQFIPDEDDSGVFITPTSLFVEDKERGAIVIDFNIHEMFDETGFIITVDPYGQFYRQYSRFLLRRANGNLPLPEWLEEGLSRIFTTLDFRKKWIEFGKVEYGFTETDADPASNPDMEVPELTEDIYSTTSNESWMLTEGPTTDKSKRERFGTIFPLDKMFDSEQAKTIRRGRWSNQCFAFIHMCVYGMNKQYQKSFIKFAMRACKGYVDETDFKECFGKSYEQMATMLAIHIDSMAQETVRYQAKKGAEGLPDPVLVELREATQAEIGRIKGEVLRLAGHADASREAFIIPYLRKERDAGLLASLGLLEALEQRSGRARKFLEAAAKENVERPRAYLELARLRLQEAQAAPAGENGGLSAAQTAAVLDPLFIARSQPPPMEDVYSLIGYTWLASDMKPKEANLEVLIEGAKRFPRNPHIVYNAAVLYTLHGDKAIASLLIDLGLKIAPDHQTREKFEELRTMQE